MEEYEIEVYVTVSVNADSREEAQMIANDWVGVTSDAPDNICFVCAEVR